MPQMYFRQSCHITCKHLGLTLFAVTFTLIFLTNEILRRFDEAITYVSIQNQRRILPSQSIEYIVDTPGCKIPNLDPMDISVAKFIHPHPPISCNFTPAFTYTEGVHLRINKTILSHYYKTELKYCEYQAIYRPHEYSDNLHKFNKTVITFTTDIKVECEFLRVVCFDSSYDLFYSNYHAFIQPKITNHRQDNVNFNHSPSKPNILIIGLDSVSRLNFIRQMPQTREFLLKTVGAYELQGFNKVADNTLVNLAPMFAGKYLSEMEWEEVENSLPFDQYDFIWKDFKKAGYVTLFGEDAPEISIFNYMKQGFEEPPTDYYLRPYSLALEHNINLWNNHHDCFRDIPESKIVLDWTFDFMKQYRNHPYFAFIFLTRLTHEDVNKGGAADILYKNYFEMLLTEGIMDNTILLFFSDHGIRFGPLRQTHIGKLEERLPFLYLAFPPNYKYHNFIQMQNLEINQHMLTTPFDIYETLKNIYQPNSLIEEIPIQKRGISLFSQIPESRNCEQAGIEPHWCACHQTKEADIRDPLIVKAALKVTEAINKKLQVVNDKCEVLSLIEINDALFLWSNASASLALKTQGYLITFTTSPGQAMFEITVRYNIEEGIFSLLGEPSRTNVYRDQGKCVKQHSLQKYCYCRK